MKHKTVSGSRKTTRMLEIKPVRGYARTASMPEGHV